MLEELYNDMEGFMEEAERLWAHYDQEPFAYDLAETAEEMDFKASVYKHRINLVSEMIEPGMWRLSDYENDWYSYRKAE
jgi:hypothetical protein